MDKLKVTMIGHISEEARVSILTGWVIKELQKAGKLPGPSGENRNREKGLKKGQDQKVVKGVM